MKKILFLLLLITSVSQAQTTLANKLKITGNTTSTTATKVNVQEIDGIVNTIAKSDLIEVLEYASAINLPVTGAIGKIYVTIDNNRLYRWTGSVYSEFINPEVLTKQFLSTGLIKNGLITINGDNTKFNISAGVGVISNFDNPIAPISNVITFGAFTGITPAYLTTGNITYLAINSSGAIVQQATDFTTSQRRDLILLGAVIHSNLTNINVVNNISAPTNADTNQLHDFMNYVGALNLDGNKYTANGANLSLNKSAGNIFKFGVNFANDWKRPHELAQAGETLLTFRYRTQNGTESGDLTVLNPALYDLNNVLTTVPNNKFTIQTVTLFQTGLTRIQYGQNVYDDLASAERAIFTRDYVTENNIKMNGVSRAYIIMRNSTTSLQNVSDAKVIEVQKFGGVASGGVALTLANIVTALGYTPENVANKQNSLAVDGTGVKYPTVDAINAVLPVTYSKIVYVNTTSPTTATIFDLNNPPVTNDNLLKTDVNNLYIGTDASTWVYKTSPAGYVTKTVTSQTSNFNIEGTSIDAGNSKTASISRLGSISATSIKRIGGLSTEYLKADGSTTVLSNPITGTGTTNTIPKWTATNTQGNSTLSDNGTTITTPSILEVANIISSKSITIDGELRSYQKNTNLYTTMLTDVIALKSGLKRSNTDFFVYLKTNTGSTVLESTFLNQPIQFQHLGTELGRFTSTGNLLVATTTNNGQGVIQANGNITASPATLSNQVVVKSQLDLKADLASPTFTGVPSVPTATAGTNTTQIASTAFVNSATKWTQTGNNITNNNTEAVMVGTSTINPSVAKFVVKGVYGGSHVIASFLDDLGVEKFKITDNADVTFGSGVTVGGNVSLPASGRIFLTSGGSGGGFQTSSGKFFIEAGSYWKTFNNIIYEDVLESSFIDTSLITKLYTDRNTLKSYTVATLPASPTQGDSYAVTDALAPAYLVTVVGGGTVYAPVVWNGTNWISH